MEATDKKLYTLLVYSENIAGILNKKENDVVTALLRNYGGLFVDMCAIDDSLIAMQTGIGRQEVYDIM